MIFWLNLKMKEKTIFLSSHNLPEVENVCDRVGILKEGRSVTIENVKNLVIRKVRNVETWFSCPGPVSIKNLTEENVALEECYNSCVGLKVRGGIGDFLKKISAYPVKDLAIKHHSLEEVFLRFYSDERAT